jgi:hypothetical protein
MARGNLGGKSACSNTKITASVDDITLLWSLMRTLPFADSFIGYAEDLGDDGIVVHGPYELIKLSTSDFRPESSAHLLSKISAFLSVSWNTSWRASPRFISCWQTNQLSTGW